MQLWVIDGQPVDRLVFKFSGSVELNSESDEDRALYNALKMGGHVEFTVAGIVAGKAHSYKPPTDERASEITRIASIKVDTLIAQDDEEDEDVLIGEIEPIGEFGDHLEKMAAEGTSVSIVVPVGDPVAIN